MTQPQVRQVKNAILDGFGRENVLAEQVEPPIMCSPDSDAFEITPVGWSGPITVNCRGIDIPDDAPPEIVAGIRLDVQAVMAK